MADSKKVGVLRPASAAKKAEWDKAKANKPTGLLKKVEPKRPATVIYQNGVKYTRVDKDKPATVKSKTYGAMTKGVSGANTTAGARATAAASRKTAAAKRDAVKKAAKKK